MAMTLVATGTVSNTTTDSILFSSIPQSGKDLFLFVSHRGQEAAVTNRISVFPNNDGTTSAIRRLYGNGSTVTSDSGSGSSQVWGTGNNATASTFGNAQVTIPNYAISGVAKTVTIDSVAPTNATTGVRLEISAFTLGTTSAVTSVNCYSNGGFFAQGTLVSLYIIS